MKIRVKRSYNLPGDYLVYQDKILKGGFFNRGRKLWVVIQLSPDGVKTGDRVEVKSRQEAINYLTKKVA